MKTVKVAALSTALITGVSAPAYANSPPLAIVPEGC